MPFSVNKVILLGRLGADARTSPGAEGGPAVTRFSVGTGYRRRAAGGEGYESRTDWHDVAVWGAGGLAERLVKGARLYLEGRLFHSSWKDADGARRRRTEVVALPSAVILLDARPAARAGKEGS